MVTNLLMPTRSVLNSPVTAIRFEEQMFSILRWARTRESRYVCIANVHMIMEAYWNREFAAILEQADIVSPDGMPLVWMLKSMGAAYQDRVAGMDVLTSLCKLASLSNVSVAFVGSHKIVLDRMRKRLESEFPKLQIACMEPLPFRPLTSSEDEALTQKLNNSGAGLVFVSLGCPKQEKWMAQHQGKIRAVMIGVGGVFPIYAGILKRAPRYVRQSGLEWLYRLMQEPRRLWYRYGKSMPPFVWLAVKQLFSKLERQDLQIPGSTQLLTSFQKLEFEFVNIDPTPAKLGEILIRQNLISPTLLNTILEEQQKHRGKLGEILLKEGIISQPELEYHLANQNIKIGEILVLNGIISQKKLFKHLGEQKFNQQKLGEILVQEKSLSQVQLAQCLREQYLRKQGLWLLDDLANQQAVEVEAVC